LPPSLSALLPLPRAIPWQIAWWAAGLVEKLKGFGTFTVFAPVNAAFAALPAGTVETLLKPINKDMLTKILTSHVVDGTWPTAEIVAAAKASPDGFHHFNAVSGNIIGSGPVFILMKMAISQKSASRMLTSRTA